jgi:RNA recognition motif-containing protein
MVGRSWEEQQEYMNIYVSNLAPETTGDELKQAFSLFGEVKHVVIAYGEWKYRHETGQYGYVEMNLKSDGVSAIHNLNGTKIRGRVINIVEALPLSNKKKRIISQEIVQQVPLPKRGLEKEDFALIAGRKS